MLRFGKQALLIGHAVAMTGIGLGGSRPQAAATGCYRAARSGPRDRAACRRLGTFVSRPLPHHPDRRDGRNRDGSASGTEWKCAQLIGNSAQPRPLAACSRARSCQGRALRVTAKAASLDSSCARLLGTTAGRGGETGFRSNRETGTGQRRRGIHAIARCNPSARLVRTVSRPSQRMVIWRETFFRLIR
jgi:hypothetical protein